MAKLYASHNQQVSNKRIYSSVLVLHILTKASGFSVCNLKLSQDTPMQKVAVMQLKAAG